MVARGGGACLGSEVGEILRRTRGGRFVADGLVFAVANVTHYGHAFFGVGCKFLPDAPEIRGFFPGVILQSVLEYRAMVLVPVFCAWVLWLAGGTWCAELVFVILLTVFTRRTVRRVWSFRSPFEFWRELWRESRHPRTGAQFGQRIALEMERAAKVGDRGRLADLETLGSEVMDYMLAKGRFQ